MQDSTKSITPQTIAALNQREGIKSEINKFRYKSFYERHKGAASAVGGAGSVLLGALSIGCAIMYVSDKIALAVGNWPAAALIASTILVALEIAKGYLLSGLFEAFYYAKFNYGAGKWLPGNAVGAVILIGASAALSIFGAESFTMKSADKTETILVQSAAQMDSLTRAFDAAIGGLEATIAEINSGRAKRWGKLLTPAENQQILNVQARIAETEKRKQDALEQAKNGTQSEIKETKTEAISAATVGGLIAFGNEAAIIFCAWFVWYFAYMVAREEKLKHGAGLSSGTYAANVDNHVSIENLPLSQQKGGMEDEAKKIGFQQKKAVPVSEPIKPGIIAEALQTVIVDKPVPVSEPIKAVPVSEPVKAVPVSEPVNMGEAASNNEEALHTVIVTDIVDNESKEGICYIRKCQNCGKEFQSKHWLTKFCPIPLDVCRKEFWEKKTGKVLIFKK